MPRIEVNFMEVMLREVLLDKTIYIDDKGVEVAVIIKELDYLPDLNVITVCDNSDPEVEGAKTYKLSLKDNFDIEYSQEKKKIKKAQVKVRGKRRKGKKKK